MPEWTPSQRNAINARGSEILVSAAAGSGKTAVLTQRVVNKVTDPDNPVNIDRLLIVTFTNAAAAEMRARISKALTELSIREPNNTNVLRQISLLPSAKICTIDSFCINLVRENFFKLDIAQDFTILDTAQERLIEDNAVNEIIEEHYQTESEDFKKLVELLCSTKNDSELVNAVKRISSYISAQPFPEHWLDMSCEQYNPDVEVAENAFGTYVISEIRHYASAALEIIDYLASQLEKGDELYDKYSVMLADDKRVFLDILTACDAGWNNLKSTVDGVKFTTLPSKRGYVSPVKTLLSNARSLYKDIIKKDIAPLVIYNSEDITADNEYLYPVINTLCGVVKEYTAKALEMKKELNSYSFSDIEHFAIQLLFYRNDDGIISRTDLATELQASFDEILVDEYQDTNAAQDYLFEMLSNGRNRFMVGDVKQSIYRFRLAMPEIFNAKKDSFEYYDEDSDALHQKIILDRNFRSRKGICDYANFLFSQLMTRKIGELDYGSDDYLNYGSDYKESAVPSVKLNLIETPEGVDTDEYEACQAAQMILSKVRSGELIREGDSYRKIKYSDFAVLFRSAKKLMPVWTQVFREYGIPVASNNRVNLFDNNEVAILLSLLRTVDNPSRDIPLLATLMSVFYGFSAEQIASAKVKHSGNNLYASIVYDTETFSDFVSDLERYREYAASMSVEGFIRLVVGETSYLSVISAMGDGEQRRLNVLKFIDIAAAFDKGENVGLTAFIRYVDRIIADGADVESAELSLTGQSSVQLMSVHQSKGLEFPVCILAGTAHKYNNTDLKDLVQLNNQSGIGLKVNNESGLYRYDSLQYSCIKDTNTAASMSENLRVLYVAVTRAKEQFITFASYKSVEKAVDRLAAKIPCEDVAFPVVKHLQCDADLILITALRHRDASALRGLTDCEVLTNSMFDFDIDISFGEDVLAREESAEETVPYSEELIEEIAEKLSFKYDKSELSAYSAKRNASELNEREIGFRFFAKSKPAFLDNSGLTSAEKGSAMHAFMQHADYSAACVNVEAEIARLLEKYCISEVQAEALDRNELRAFFNSDVFKRMLKSDRVYREIRLSSFVPVCELEETKLTEPVLVQGVADCIFEEDGKLILVDYKTDRVSSEDELLDMYKKQLSFYKSAAEKSLNKPVSQSLLYSFYLQKECVYK